MYSWILVPSGTRLNSVIRTCWLRTTCWNRLEWMCGKSSLCGFLDVFFVTQLFFNIDTNVNWVPSSQISVPKLSSICVVVLYFLRIQFYFFWYCRIQAEKNNVRMCDEDHYTVYMMSSFLRIKNSSYYWLYVQSFTNISNIGDEFPIILRI